MTFSETFISEAKEILDRLPADAIECMARGLASVRDAGGRLFILGLGGSAANASHAVNDFRKIAAMEAYAPTDNVSELTARINDESWEGVFVSWLNTSRLSARDAILVLSVGGGNAEKNISTNLIAAVRYAKGVGAAVFGIVGAGGGYTAQAADICVVVPAVNPAHVTAHTEAFQAFVWHLLVSHPEIRRIPAAISATSSS